MSTQLHIECANEQSSLIVDESRWIRAAELILRDAGVKGGNLSIAAVDDAEIHRINREFLQHDYPTDVLSFVFDEDRNAFDGEVIVSAEMAIRNAPEFAWPPTDELLLYVIHGTLHLVGFRDKTDAERIEMRQAEAKYLRSCDVELPLPIRDAGHTAMKGA
jgi:probable rRNA maturation factor